MKYVDSTGLLRLFFEGSEDLWGMVDWEEGTCDFSGELFMENARMLPVRTEPLMDTICEEAAYYFNGSKSVEETERVIRNRVQLYLNEHK